MFHFSYTEKKYIHEEVKTLKLTFEEDEENVERWLVASEHEGVTRGLIRRRNVLNVQVWLLWLIRTRTHRQESSKMWRKGERSYSFCCYCSDFWEWEWRREREWGFISRHFSQSKNKRDVWRFWNKANPLVVAQKKKTIGDEKERTKV